MPAEQLPKKGTNQFMRMGHTAHIYGNDPAVEAQGKITAKPRELKPQMNIFHTLAQDIRDLADRLEGHADSLTLGTLQSPAPETPAETTPASEPEPATAAPPLPEADPSAAPAEPTPESAPAAPEAPSA